jgi:hypothetical protein
MKPLYDSTKIFDTEFASVVERSIVQSITISHAFHFCHQGAMRAPLAILPWLSPAAILA